jgi:asparagine synthase (glutamine-hydrolysing)
VYRAEHRELTIKPYWKIGPPIDEAPDDEEVLDRTQAALEQSVERQLVSDVPLGAFLSGGIDSSLVTAAMSRHAAGRVQTFSMSFRTLSAAADESRYARQVAEHLGAEHHEVDAREIGGEEMMAMIQRLDQPLADPAYLPSLMLSQRCREHITVALSGDGGDELFGGYGRYAQDHAFFTSRTPRLLAGLRSPTLRGWLPGGLLSATLTGNERVFWNNFLFGDYPVSRKSLRGVFAPEAYRGLQTVETMARWKSRASSFSPRWDTDTLMRCDLWSYLSDNCLVKTDRAGMAASLEIRVPLLGNALVDYILPLHARVKYRHGGKWILKQLCRRYELPECVWNRPKHGFSVPLEDYFQGPWRATVEDLIRDAGQLAPFLNAAVVQKTWDRVLHQRRRARFLWAILVLLIWLRTHQISP